MSKKSSHGKAARARRRERQRQQSPATQSDSTTEIESDDSTVCSSDQTKETVFDSDAEIPTSKPAMEANKKSNIDIISRFPPEITNHVLSFLPDPEKVRFSGVCKGWENRAKLWQKDHSQQIKKIYPSLSDVASPDWKTFKKTVKHATLYPSSRPSGKLQTESNKVHYHNSKKYVAWIDDQAGDLWVGTLRRLGSVEPGEGRIDILDVHNISELLEITEYNTFGEILTIDDESGIVVVAVGQIVIREELVIHAQDDLQVEGEENMFRLGVKDTTRVMAGFFGFDIDEEMVAWTCDTDGNFSTLGNAPKEEAETSFVKDYVYGYSSGNILFKDGLFIKATTKIEERVFSLWHMDVRTGKQKCVQSDVLGHANVPSNSIPGIRFEPRLYEVDRRWRFRWDYKCDSFDIKMLPFRNPEGKQEYAVITWSMDFTNSALNPDFLDDNASDGVPDEDTKEVAKTSSGVNSEIDNHSEAQSASGSTSDDEELAAEAPGFVTVSVEELKALGLQLFPSDWDMSKVSNNIDILDDPANAAIFGDGRGDYLCRALGETMLGNDLERSPKAFCHTCILLINVNTGSIIENITLPSHQVNPEVVKSIRQNYNDCTDQEYDRAEIVEIINGTHGFYIRYPIGMQIYMQEPEVEVSGPAKESVTLNVVQYTGIQRICALRFPPFSPFHLPESWSVTVNHHKSSGTPSFDITNLSNTLYKITAYRFTRGPPKFIINPSIKLGLDIANFEPEGEFDFAAEPNLDPEEQHQPVITIPTGNGDEVEILQPDIAVHAEILEFEEVEEFGFVRQPEEDGPVWKMKWMETVKKSPVMHPVNRSNGELKRIGWQSQFAHLARMDESEPIEIGENGIKFGGLWVWN